jgi:DNA invertase Pin-like site-specific DNA recombinase
LKAATYVRVSAADAGRSPLPQQDRLRSFAEGRGWTVELEICDPGPWPEGRRPGLDKLTAAIKAGTVQVVVVQSLDRLARSLRHLANLGGLLVAQDVGLVAMADVLDTTDPGGRARFQDLVEVINGVDKAHRSEASRVGRVRSALKGADNWGAPCAEINPLELKGLWEGVAGARPLSTREIAKKLGHSAGTILKYLRELRESGKLDDELRAERLVACGGLRKGGRPSKSGKWNRQRDEELLEVFQGDRPQPISVICRTFRLTRYGLGRHLERLSDAGRLEPGQRAANLQKRRR